MSLAVAVWLVLCLIWGSTWLFIKLGLADLPPVSFAGLRFVVAAAVLGEHLGARAFLGTALILVGVFLGARRPVSKTISGPLPSGPGSE